MVEKKFKYRLGLDLGTNSIGWCMLRLNKDNEPAAVIKSGVRIFHDGRNEKQKSLWQLSAEMPAVLEEILIEKYPAEIIC